MKIIRGRQNLPSNIKQTVVTLGNFDGVHLGHQAILKTLKKEGVKTNAQTVVIVFEPQPLEFLVNDKAPVRLTSLREKYQMISEFGIDFLYVIKFNDFFSQTSATEFIEHYLIQDLKVKTLIVGDDVRFGNGREGNRALLDKYSKQFNVIQHKEQTYKSQRLSSSNVRHLLKQSDFKTASELLGRLYSIEGNVVYGNQLARQFGFPTANINMNRKNPALHGVYLVQSYHQESNQIFYGIANIGMRPTINGKHAILEVHLFDFDENIYGHHLKTTFIKKIRDEVRFDSLEALKIQIIEDICKAQKIQAELLNI